MSRFTNSCMNSTCDSVSMKLSALRHLHLSLVVLIVTSLTPAPSAGTKIIDYDNVVENPYYRKSNLDLLIRRHCNFLQEKTSSTPAPIKPKFSDRLKNAFQEVGQPVKCNSELPARVVDGLIQFIRAVHPNHELTKRNMTKEERTQLMELLPDLIDQMEAEDPEYLTD